MSLPIIQPITQYYDLSGGALEAGYIYIGAANSDPETTPIDIFWDAAGLVPASQPVRTIAGYPARSGSPAPIYVNVTEYSVRWKESDGTLVAYIPSVPVPVVTTSAFGISLVTAANAEAARVLLELVIGTDVQAFDADIATEVATEAQMRAGTEPDLKSMSPALVADAIDELGTDVRVTASDTTPRTLMAKLDADTGITMTLVDPGADETLLIGLDGDLWPGVYEGSSAAALTFPVGSIVLSNFSGGGYPDRNEAVPLYLLAGYAWGFSTAVNGTALTGTWRFRGGHIDDSFGIFQRTE